MAVSNKWLIRTCAAGLLVIGSFLAAAFLFRPERQLAAPLPPLNVDPHAITLAGNSSGGFMAIQAGVAYSGTFRGVAVVGSGPYYCTEGDVATGRRCAGQTTPGIPVDRLVQMTRRWADEGRIDPVKHIAAQRVYVFRGTLDSVIPLEVAQAVIDFYAHFMPAANAKSPSRASVKKKAINPIVGNFTTPVAHGWVSPYGTNSCMNETENFLNKCHQVDLAAEFLTLFYGPLQAKNEQAPTGTILEFDQNEFFDDMNADAHSADELGFAYVPAACGKQERCRAVIALHGCDQDYGKVDKIFITQSGINQWADTNRIVVVYPQIKALNLKNARGCWDNIGYDGPDFAWKSGHQVKMLKRIADRIAAVPAAANKS